MRSLVLAALLLAPAQALAQTPFDGTWTLDLETARLADKVDPIELRDGRFRAPTSVPPIDVKADGTDQVVNAPYFDSIAITVLDDRTVGFRYKKNGTLVSEWTSVLSADGETIVDTWTYHPPEGPPVKGAGRRERVGSRVEGAHLLSGSWRIKKLDQIADAALTWTFESTPDGLRMRMPTGESYDAKFDGKDYPILKDRAGTTVSIKRIGDRTVEETLKRGGKVVGVGTYTVSDDGRTMKATLEDKEHGTTESWVARKQPE